MNSFICEQFGLQTEAFVKILFLFANSASDDEHDDDHLSLKNTNMAICSRIVGWINFVNWGTSAWKFAKRFQDVNN